MHTSLALADNVERFETKKIHDLRVRRAYPFSHVQAVSFVALLSGDCVVI